MNVAIDAVPARYPDLEGKVVLITGSSKAIGMATAKAFAAQGSRVVVHGRDQEAVHRIAEEIRDSGAECIGVVANVTSEVDLASLLAQIDRRFGDVDVLACFAGGMGRPVGVLEMDATLWRQTLEVDLTSKFLTVRAFAPRMLKRRAGSIILMSSAAGRSLSKASAAYGAAQAATLMLMRHLAHDFGPAGVRVNGIAPSTIRNEKMDLGMSPDLQKDVANTLPLRRLGEPNDVANAALFLASSASSWITGEVIDVNGGKGMI